MKEIRSYINKNTQFLTKHLCSPKIDMKKALGDIIYTFEEFLRKLKPAHSRIENTNKFADKRTKLYEITILSLHSLKRELLGNRAMEERKTKMLIDLPMKIEESPDSLSSLKIADAILFNVINNFFKANRNTLKNYLNQTTKRDAKCVSKRSLKKRRKS